MQVYREHEEVMLKAFGARPGVGAVVKRHAVSCGMLAPIPFCPELARSSFDHKRAAALLQ